MAALATPRSLDELTAAQLEALYGELETIKWRLRGVLGAQELRELLAGFEAAQRAVYARLATPVQRLLDGDR